MVIISRSAGVTKRLMAGSPGNSEFCFPATLNVPSGTFRVPGKQNSLFHLEPVNQLLLFDTFYDGV